MDRAYTGESFELEFTMSDARDSTRTVDAATFVVSLEGTVKQSGSLALTGNVGSFRFSASEPGIFEIVVSWSMGQDRWKQPFLISVEDP